MQRHIHKVTDTDILPRSEKRGMYVVSTDVTTYQDRPSSSRIAPQTASFLPRKEVIHPHVPVRIPCYDLTPIISPTLGPGKLARQVLATFMV